MFLGSILGFVQVFLSFKEFFGVFLEFSIGFLALVIQEDSFSVQVSNRLEIDLTNTIPSAIIMPKQFATIGVL